MDSKKDFTTIKEEMSIFCVEVEKQRKSAYLLEKIYFQMFGKLICEEMRQSILLDKYRNAILMKERGDSTEDIRKMIAVAFTEVDKKYQVLCLKYNNSLRENPFSENLKEEYLQKLEIFFEKVSLRFHPDLFLEPSAVNEKYWKFFVYCYQNNNLEGMKMAYAEMKLIDIEESPVLLEKFKTMMEHGRKEIKINNEKYPFTIRGLISDDMLSARETAIYRQKISDKKHNLLKLMSEYKNLFQNKEVF